MIQGKTIRITPECVKNHGIENRVNLSFNLLREDIIKSIKAFPKSTIHISYKIEDN